MMNDEELKEFYNLVLELSKKLGFKITDSMFKITKEGTIFYITVKINDVVSFEIYDIKEISIMINNEPTLLFNFNEMINNQIRKIGYFNHCETELINFIETIQKKLGTYRKSPITHTFKL